LHSSKILFDKGIKMAQVTITLSDKEDGSVTLSLDFQPELVEGQEQTQAQLAASHILKLISGAANG